MPGRPAPRPVAITRESNEVTGRLRTTTSIKRDEVERKRNERGRDGVGRRSPAIAARRRLSATRPGAVGNGTSPFGPRDPRFDYLTHSHD
jgi:hypothetical protein